MTKPVKTEAEIITQLERSNAVWAHTAGSSTVINYSFVTTVRLGDLSNSSADYDTYVTCSDAEKAAVAASHLAFSDATMITFVEVADDGNNDNKISYATTTIMPSGTWGWSGKSVTSGIITGSYIWVNNPPSTSPRDYALGGYNLSAMTHETEHSMGIPHPGDYGAGDGSTYESAAIYAQDSTQYTIMSYWAESETGANYNGHEAQTLLRDDIAVLQALYGANTTVRTGDTVYGFHSTETGSVYDFSSNTTPVLCIWDAGGNDTLDFSGFSGATRMDLNAGGFSSTPGYTYNVSIAIGATVENAIGGSGNDTIFGGTGANSINGGAGDDLIVFDAAHNIDPSYPEYGTANDTFTTADTVDGGAGSDTVELHGDYSAGLTLGATTVTNVETLKLADGYSYNITTNDSTIASGQTLTVDGSALTGTNAVTLDGSAETNGSFVFIGGAGNDTFTGGAGTDFASYQSAAAGVSVNLSSGATHTVAGLGTDTFASIEGLIGSAYDDTLTGDGGANVLEGGLGNDSLIGNGGTDTVSYAHSASAVVVDLGAGTATGGEGNDTLTGIANVIGSAYNDTFAGGAANNTFNGDGGSDTVTYAAATTGVTVNLGTAGAQAVGGGQGSDTFVGIEGVIGSAYADTLSGDSGANTLEGGLGDDVLAGGGGTDTVSYASSTSAVTVNLATGTGTGGEGNDTLSGFENILGSAYNDTLTGDSGNNTFFGDAGDDTISGGTGTDTLDYSAATAAIKVDLATTSAQTIGGGMGVDKLSAIEAVIGSAYNDDLRAGSSTVSLYGGAGDDKIYAWNNLTSASRIDGGAGSDTVYMSGSVYASGITFQATTIQNIETVYFYSSNSYNVTESDGNVAAGASLTVAAYGATAGQSVRFDGSAETDGAFTFMAGAASDTFIGGAGGDTFYTKGDYLSASDTYDGGAGKDSLTFNGTTTATLSASNLQNIEKVWFSKGYNSSVTTIDANVAAGKQLTVNLIGMNNTDAVSFDGSAETDGTFDFYVTTGTGTFTGGAGADTFEVHGTSGLWTFNGGGGDDVYNMSSYLVAGMQIDGGAGNNSLKISGTYSGETALVFADTTIKNIAGIWFAEQYDYNLTMADGNVAAGQTLNVYANEAKTLVFNGAAETNGGFHVLGTAKSDTITGGGGNDWIDGQQDIYGAGGDTLTGGAGTDWVSYQHLYWYGATVNLTLQGAMQYVWHNGDYSRYVGDTLSGFENIFGSYQNDTLTGDAGANTIEGWVGNDRLDGGTGNDTASYALAVSGVTVSLAIATAQSVGGGMGNDTLSGFENLLGSDYADTLTGDAGDNTLTGGAGNDVLDGGAGTDTVVFSGNFADYTANQNGYGVYTVTGTDGTDVVSNVEFAQFADQTIAVDTAAPTLSSSSPADEATGVAASANIVLTFSEAVHAGPGNIVIYKSDGSVVATIAANDSSQVVISGATVTINPATDLAVSTGYYVRMDAGAIKDQAGNYFTGLAAATDLNFTTAAAADVVAPTVTATNPADDATGVGIGANFVVTFSEAVKAGSGNFIIHKTDGTAVATIAATDATQVSISGNTVTVNPVADLAYATGYYITVDSGAITDIAGNAYTGLSSVTAYNFTTGAAPDTTAPTLSATSPADDATGVSLTADITMTFSEAVKAGTGNIVVHAADGTVLSTIASTDTTQVTFSGNTMTLATGGHAESGTSYYITVDAGAITDLAGNAYAGISSATGFNFTMADVVAPTVTATNPADDATGVAIGANFVVTFSEAVKAGSGNFIIHKTDGTAVATIAATDATQVSISGNTVTVNPVADLAYATGYYITVDSGAITDIAGNAYTGLSSATAYNFTTGAAPDTTAPTLSATSPADNATNVAVGANLVLTFSEAVKAGTGNIVIHSDSTYTVLATIAVTDATQVTISGNTLTINPTADLIGGYGFYVTIDAGAITDLAGNAYAGISEYSTTFSFSTATSTITGTSGDDTLTGNIGADNIYGLGGNDLLIGGAGYNLLDGGDGSDTVSYADRTTWTVVDLSTGQVVGFTPDIHDTLVSIENVIGGSASDSLTGDANDNVLSGGAGDDGLTGGAGNDTLIGGPGNDVLYGDDGTDTAVFSGNMADYTIINNTGSYTISGADGTDSLVSIERVQFADQTIILPSDVVAPTLSSTSPADDAANVDVKAHLVLTFSEWVKAGTGNIVLHNSDGSIAATFAASDRTSVSIAGATVTIPMAWSLLGGLGYYVTVDAGAITDLAGNAYAGTASATALNFIAGPNTITGTATGEGLVGTAGVDIIFGLGGDDRLYGEAEHDTLIGGAGNDTLDGGDNIDTAVVSGNSTAYTVTQTSTGVFSVVGPDGSDTLTHIEFLKFDDTTIRLIPGTGVTIDFSADPNTYLGALKDFGGNSLGGDGGWQLIGRADTNLDGIEEYLYGNSTISRWAEVAVQADGKVYFNDNSWAGNTRVVGNYIDPLIPLGIVVAGSDEDSQRRFANDLRIGNIKGVLGEGDYNHDGLQEIYFSLTDNTAVLHAYMHADGNIQYANYQNEAQAEAYLTTNGWTSTTWTGWFPLTPASMVPLSSAMTLVNQTSPSTALGLTAAA